MELMELKLLIHHYRKNLLRQLSSNQNYHYCYHLVHQMHMLKWKLKTRLPKWQLLPKLSLKNQIAKDEFIQDALQQKFGKRLTHPTTVKTYTVSYAKHLQAELKLKFEKDMNARYVLAFDKWTSKRNRRYMGLELFSVHEVFNLDLIRLIGLRIL